jgi:hypothetical protein
MYSAIVGYMTDFGRLPLRLFLVAATLWIGAASSAFADQRRDYMLEDVGASGNFLLLDYFGTGAQVGIEHRGSIFGKVNDYTLNTSALVGYPVGQVTASAAVRVLFLRFGGSIGYRTVWRNLSFEPGDDGEYCKACDRGARRDRDPILGKGPDTDHFMMAEGSVSLFAPFNEWVVFTSQLAARYEGLRPRSYDWFFTNVHDPGLMTRLETLLFFKHRDWGGFAPYLQIMWLPRGGHHDTEVAWGFNAVTRLGLIQRNDLLFATFLIRPGDGSYGQHAYYSPVRALLIYRMQLDL